MATNNNQQQAVLDKALGTLKAGGTVPISKTSAARQVDGVIYIYNPQVVQAFEFVGNKQKTAAAVKAGKISAISKAELAAALTPKPSVPKTTPKPKPKLKGKADDDSSKKQPPKPQLKVRKDADPELTTSKRLKNPLGALSSYNYQISLYMITPDAMQTFRADGFKSISKLGTVFANQITDIEGAGISAGAYIVAQSGGVNNQFESRAPSFGFDYSIDNLSFEVVTSKESGSPAAEYNFNFTITEPYGFSFISNLKRASQAISDYNQRIAKKRAEIAKKKAAAKKQREEQKKNDANKNRQADQTSTTPQTDNSNTSSGTSATPSNPDNATKQLFVLGIRFFGYDASGKPVRGSDTTAAVNSFSGVFTDENGDIVTQEIDPGNTSYNLFERYYPILLTEVKTTLDGRATRYDCVATGLGMEALGTKRGMINNNITVKGSTVGEQLDDLMAQMNKEQKNLQKNSTEIGYTYDIKYASEYDATRIRSATIVSKADLDKYKWPGSGAKKTQDSNSNTESQQSKPKNDERTLTIKGQTSIIQAINQIVAQSSFLEDALRTVFTTALEPDQDKSSAPALDLSGKKTIEWISITPDISNLQWNSNTADWVYDLNYVLNVYDTPVLDTAYTNPGKKYYGPVKRYEYWYSGTNTEVIKYQQVLDNNYYTTFISDDFGKESADKKANQNGGQNTKEATNGAGNASGVTSSKVANQKTGQPTQGKQGMAMEAQNSYLTSLFDISAQATATVNILGDPDWLMATNNTQEGQDETIVYNKFYGTDGFAISPSGGQVFFEIDFKEAIDYKSEGMDIMINENGAGVTGAPGTLSINSSIMFWKDPKSVSKLVRGLSYSCNKVKSEFRNGLFTQILTANLNTFADAGSIDDGTGRENNNETTNSGPNKGNSNATTTNTGLKKPTGNSAASKPTTPALQPGSNVPSRASLKTTTPPPKKPTPRGDPTYDPQTGQLLGYTSKGPGGLTIET